MSKNIEQVFLTNPIASNTATDLMYFGRSPYGVTNDAAMTYANFSAQFGAPYTSSALTGNNDTNVTISLGGSPLNALLHATSITMGWLGQLSSARGGTGINNGSNTATFSGNLNFANSFTTSGTFPVIQTYTGSTNITFPTSGTLATTSQLPTPAALTTNNDTNVTLTLSGSPSTALLNASSITAGWTGILDPVRGGLGSNGIPTNGQIPLASSGIYSPSNLIAGTGISIVTAPTSVTISSSGAGSWIEQTTNSVTMTANTTYSINNGPIPVLLTLPATANGGDFIRILGFSGGGWIVGLNSSVGGQFIMDGNVITSTSTGLISSTNHFDCITLYCVFNGSVIWTVGASQGQPNVT